MSFFRGGGFKTKHANPYSMDSINRLNRKYPAKRNTYGRTQKSIKGRALERKLSETVDNHQSHE